jgi:hypothetical protein
MNIFKRIKGFFYGTTQKMVETENDMLIRVICRISYIMACGQIMNIDRLFRMVNGHLGIDREIFDIALKICRQQYLINGQKSNYVYQIYTASHVGTMTISELHKAIDAIELK